MVMLADWAQAIVTLRPLAAAEAIAPVGLVYKLHVGLGLTPVRAVPLHPPGSHRQRAGVVPGPALPDRASETSCLNPGRPAHPAPARRTEVIDHELLPLRRTRREGRTAATEGQRRGHRRRPAGPRAAIPPGGQLRAGAGGRLPCADRPPVAPATGRRAGHRRLLRRRRDAGGSAHPPIAGGRGAGPGSRRRRLPDLVRGQSGTPARPLAPALRHVLAARRTTWRAARRRASRLRSCSTNCAGIPSASSTWPGVSPPVRRRRRAATRLDRAGQTVPEFEKRLLRRAPGLLEHPLESRYGLHVVELCEGGEPLDFDAARAQIAAHLQAQVLQRAVGQYIGVLAGDACIEGFAFEGADGALVQ